jgi:hypothetical protein
MDELTQLPPTPQSSGPLPQEQTVMQRTPPELDEGEVKLIKDWHRKIEEAKAYWGPRYKRMRSDTKFAQGHQWAGQTEDDERYRANITLRHINQRVASIYAKNPRVRAEKRPRLYAVAWDGSQEQLMAAQQTLQIMGQVQAASAVAAQAGQVVQPPQTPLPPEMAQQVMKEYVEAQTQKQLYDRMGRTLELVAQYSLDEPIPKFKPQAKQLVRRTLTTGCGFLKLGYQRLMRYDSADIDARIKDATEKLSHIETLMADLADKQVTDDSQEAAELRSQIKQLQGQRELVLREGLVFSFPKSWNIVIDPSVTQLKGFVGAEWVAEEYIFTPKQVQRIFKVDVSSQYSPHAASGNKADRRFKDQKFCAVYQIYDLSGRQSFTICLGYEGWLREPGEPDVELEQFHPYFVLTFNDIEPDADDESVYPPSDVELMRSMQIEYIRAREAKRIHRQANRPAYLSPKGVFDEDTKQKLGTHLDHELIETNLSKNEDITKAIQAKPTVPIDESLYEVETPYIDAMRVVGDQSANLGPTSGATATESSIAEQSRVTSIQSNIDDLDEFLTEVMRGAGQILLKEMSAETVKKIAGPGAVWPQFSKAEIAEELVLEIKAGSSGKPNRQARLAAIEKTAPFLLQIPGIKPQKMADFMLSEIDEGIEVEDFMDESLPSIVAMNAMAKPNLAPQPGGPAQAAMGGAHAEAPGGTGAEQQNIAPAPDAARGSPLTPS